jgi:hypothetical protein
MTVRAYINRCFLNLLVNVVVLFAALQILGLSVRYWPRVFAAAPWVYLAGAAALWSGMAWYALRLLRIPCPRCSQPLGGVGLAAVVGIRTFNQCSHCRIGLDEPAQAANDP